MARKSVPAGPIPVNAYLHADKRVNNPTADAADEWFDDTGDAHEPVRYPRNTALDPQLIWRGKDAQDDILVVESPPIYRQETIDPRVLVENLRKTAAAGDAEPELTLFEHFDGLEELDRIEFYRHQMTWQNRMILGDSLQVMGSLAQREQLRGTVQMIYIDPPYGIKFGSNWQASARTRDVKDGKIEDAAREAEQIKAFRDTWSDGIHTYLSYLRDRLVAARELLTESGSVFVQIGDENVHLVRSLMDEVFGPENFITTIVVRKKSATTITDPVNDFVLWAARNRATLRTRQLFYSRPEPGGESKFKAVIMPDGEVHRTARATQPAIDEWISAGGEWARVDYPIVSQHPDPIRSLDYVWNGVAYSCGNNSQWRFGVGGQMDRLALAGRLFAGRGTSLGGVMYWNDWPYVTYSNLWLDLHGESDPVYVVQTNTKIIERCMLMTTDPGDLVLDPTCGSGTTAYVAEQWGRRWITIDTSRVALALARQRLMGGRYPYYMLADSPEGRRQESAASGRSLPPAETRGDIHHGFVYQRVQHVTLKSVANNPDIVEGMTRAEIDAAVKRHAEYELLYDRPYEDKKRVRVTGPFTVESLSPYRSLSFGDADVSGAEQAADDDASGADFAQTILDSLRASGIQNGRRDERIEFATLDAHAGLFVQAMGERASEDADTAPSHVAIALGPQYGTVSPGFIKDAAREALKDPDVDLLCVLGFAFDPQATGITEADGVTLETGDAGFARVESERRLGRIKVLLVRMNAELLMGDALKKTGAGNLFTVFGEPDIEIREVGEQFEVQLHGVDVYDPTTGVVRSRQTDRVALWMIDTDYDDESFFVRHCYFTGGGDPMKKLERALKADVDADAWAFLYRTISLPFDRPSNGRVAVKVINDYGDEVMRVIDV